MRVPRTLWLLLSLGALLRIAAIELRPAGALAFAPDEPEYLEIAQNIAHGHGFSFHGEPTAYRDPLFPFFAAAKLAVWHSARVVYYAQLFLDLCTAFLLFLIVRRRATDRAALLVAGAWCLYPAAILFTALFLTETLFVFLWVLALFVYERLGRRVTEEIGGIGLGAILGLLMLARSTGVILILAILVHLLTRRRYRVVMTVLATVIVVALPWMIRNARVMGTFALNTNSGINLYQGSNPYATGAYRFDEPVTAPLEFDRLNEVERNRRAIKLSVDYWRAHPVQAIALWPKKFAYFWSTDMSLWAHYLPRPGMSLAQMLRAVPVILLVLTGLAYVAIAVSGTAGLVLVKDSPWHGLLILQLSLAAVAALATYGLARYHFPLMPVLLLGAASLESPHVWHDAPLNRRITFIILLVILLAIWSAETIVIIQG